jgi:hypothetical protein
MNGASARPFHDIKVWGDRFQKYFLKKKVLFNKDFDDFYKHV